MGWHDRRSDGRGPRLPAQRVERMGTRTPRRDAWAAYSNGRGTAATAWHAGDGHAPHVGVGRSLTWEWTDAT